MTLKWIELQNGILRRFAVAAICLFPAAIVAGCGGTGSESDTGVAVATIGDRTIEMRRIIDQINAWQMTYPTDEATLTARRDILERLIKDQFLIIGAYSRALDADIGIVELVDREKDKFLLDELFRREIIEKAIVTEKDIETAYERWFERVRPMHILVESKTEADSVRAALDAGKPFDELAVDHSIDRGTLVRGGDFGREFQWGELMEPIQSAVWPLKEGEIVGPIESDFGWHIIGVKSRRQLTKTPLDQVRGLITQRLEGRAQEERRLEQLEEMRDRANVRLDEAVLSTLRELADAGRDTLPPSEKMQPTLPESSVDPNVAAEIFARFGTDGSTTTEDFVQKYNARPPMGRPSLDDEEMIKDFIFQEGLYDLLREEGLRLKLDEEPVYRERLREFQEKLMAEKMRNNIIARNLVVTEDHVREFYDSHIDSLKESEQFHVREVMVNREADAEAILRQAKSGADFEALAREHTVRPGFKNNAGDLGWVDDRRYGELFETASKLEIGEIGGPVPGVDQYSVIKLLEKKPSRIREYDEVKTSIFTELQKRRTIEIMDAYKDSMSAVYPVVIHEEILREGLQGSKSNTSEQTEG